jgi:hypothetical protein
VSRRLLTIAVVLIALIAAAQLIRPKPMDRPIDPARTIAASLGPSSEVPAVLDRACGDCHSNRAAAWPWYGNVAPLSWILANGVDEARKAVNYSEWASYSPARQRSLLAVSCTDALQGKMPPGVYVSLNPAGRLSSRDIQKICTAGPAPGPARP